jgi:Sulfite exporter TauE/SafE
MLSERFREWKSTLQNGSYPSFAATAFTLSGLVILFVIIFELSNSNDSPRFAQSQIRRALEEIQHITRHKDLFPLDHSDVVGTLMIGLGLMIAASGGVGGGGILVPLLIIVLGFHPKYAIPLSNFTILGSSITNMILNIPKRHPEAERPLVDWDLILVMEPVTMAGAVRLYPAFFMISLNFRKH